MSMLTSGVAWLQGQRKQFLSVEGLYQQGASQIPNLAVTLGTTEFVVDDSQTLRIAADQVDLIVTAADMVTAGGQAIVPAQGDTYTFGSQIFEVRQPDGSTRVYTQDPTGQQWRIHSHRIQ